MAEEWSWGIFALGGVSPRETVLKKKKVTCSQMQKQTQKLSKSVELGNIRITALVEQQTHPLDTGRSYSRLA